MLETDEAAYLSDGYEPDPGIQIVHENEFHVWAVCPCSNHIGGELYGQGEHGSARHCCDAPHAEPGGIVRFGKRPGTWVKAGYK